MHENKKNCILIFIFILIIGAHYFLLLYTSFLHFTVLVFHVNVLMNCVLFSCLNSCLFYVLLWYILSVCKSWHMMLQMNEPRDMKLCFVVCE